MQGATWQAIGQVSLADTSAVDQGVNSYFRLGFNACLVSTCK